MKSLLALLLALAATGAGAQTVYRCGSAYSDAPCPRATTLEVNDSRSAAQRADAQRVTAAERRLGEQMARDRAAREAAAKLRAASLSGAPAQPVERPRAKKLKAWKKPKKTAAKAG